MTDILKSCQSNNWSNRLCIFIIFEEGMAAMQEVKYHPASVDLELIKRLIAVTKCTTLRQFLFREFSSISKDYAGDRPLT